MSEAHCSRRTLRRIGAVITGLLAIAVILYLSLYIVASRALNKTDIDAKQKTVTSRDGTLVAFEQTGAGPVVILVTGALADRSGTRWLAKRLAEHFTVINYDRRGRGKSTDTQPSANAE
jgi:pimeloyl-ACP methyl ester carboxylesterase